jgi:hypothetical protein
MDSIEHDRRHIPHLASISLPANVELCPPCGESGYQVSQLIDILRFIKRWYPKLYARALADTKLEE